MHNTHLLGRAGQLSQAYFTPGGGGGGGGGGGVLPMWWVIHMCRGFDPLFSLWQDRARSFWGIFLIHQQQCYLLGYKNYQFLQKSIFLAPNSIFSSIFLGPIFSGQRHTPISFQAEYPPPPRDFTHSPPILTLRNLPPTVNKQCPPLWESRMSRHTRFNTSRKRQLPRWTVYFLVQMQLTGRYDHRPESDFVFLLFVTEKLIQLWWNPTAQGRPRMREASSVSCQVAT